MRVLVLAGVLLAAGIGTAQAKTRQECIERYRGWLDGDKPMTMTAIKRLCDPKTYVTDPNEYGWACDWDIHAVARVKGKGAKQRRDAYCSTE